MNAIPEAHETNELNLTADALIAAHEHALKDGDPKLKDMIEAALLYIGGGSLVNLQDRLTARQLRRLILGASHPHLELKAHWPLSFMGCDFLVTCSS